MKQWLLFGTMVIARLFGAEQAEPVEQQPLSDAVAEPAKQKAEEKEQQTIDVKLVPPECVPSTLDTTDASAGGNWVIKRAFWEAAVTVYEKIVQQNDQLFPTQMEYVNKRNEVNKLVDTNFIELGFDRGQLSQLLISLTEDLERQKELRGDLSVEERAELNKLKDKQKLLDQFKTELDMIDQLDNALDEVLVQLTKSVNLCREYEKKAWENYKFIGKELNDKRAKELYYQMEGYYQTVQKNVAYLTGDLMAYFTNTIDSMNDRINKLKQQLADLQQAGADLQQEYEQFYKKDVKALREAEQEEAKKQQAEIEQLMKEKQALAECKKASEAWYIKLYHWLGDLFFGIASGLTDGINWLMRLVRLK